MLTSIQEISNHPVVVLLYKSGASGEFLSCCCQWNKKKTTIHALFKIILKESCDLLPSPKIQAGYL
jgi:hypothetical protein